MLDLELFMTISAITFFYVNNIIAKNNIIIENIEVDLPTFYNLNE